MKLRINLGEKGAINSLCIIITLLMSKNILFILPHIFVYRHTINNIVIIAVMILFTIRLPFIIRNAKNATILTCLLFIIYFGVQYLCFNDNRPFLLMSIPKVIVYGIIPFLFVLAIDDYELLLKKIRNTSIIITLVAVWGFSGIFLHDTDSTYYNMSYGNALSLAVLVMEYYTLSRKNVVDICTFIVGALMGIILGSRIVLIEVVVMFLAYYVLIESGLNVKAWVKRAIIFFVGLGCAIFYTDILLKIHNILDSRGLSSRTLEMLMKGRLLAVDEGRLFIYDVSLDLAKQHPQFGIGYAGLEGAGYVGWDPHNTYLELITYNGFLIGVVLIAAFVFIWAHGLYSKNNKWLHVLIVIVACLFIPRSLVGVGILLENMHFWLLLGLCIKSFLIKRQVSVVGDIIT